MAVRAGKCLRERSWDEQQLTPAQRAKARAEPEGLARITASLKRLAVWARSRVLPKSTLGKACDYLLSQWAPLIAHLHHGESRLDNNLVENAIRPSCIGKKNWLFIGHPDAGQRSAILYSLIVSCQRHGKDPLAYEGSPLTLGKENTKKPIHMFSNHSALIEIAAFDFLIGFVLFRYYRAGAHTRRSRLIPYSVGIIATLVNASGFFCNASVVAVVVVLGGSALLTLLFRDDPKEEKAPNQPPEPTAPSGRGSS